MLNSFSYQPCVKITISPVGLGTVYDQQRGYFRSIGETICTRMLFRY